MLLLPDDHLPPPAIGAHGSGAVTLLFFLFEQWDGRLYWWIFAFCRSVEVLVAPSEGRTEKARGPFPTASLKGGRMQEPLANQLHLQVTGIKKVTELQMEKDPSLGFWRVAFYFPLDAHPLFAL